MIELQRYRLLSDLHESEDWDIMGHAYEQYTATYLKKKRGQFFTNRLVVDFLSEALDPDYQDIILDPAGGSGGFSHGRDALCTKENTKFKCDEYIEATATR